MMPTNGNNYGDFKFTSKHLWFIFCYAFGRKKRLYDYRIIGLLSLYAYMRSTNTLLICPSDIKTWNLKNADLRLTKSPEVRVFHLAHIDSQCD